MTKTAFCAALGLAAAAFTSAPASAATLCVGAKPPCFTSIQAAVDAAADGDTIEIGPSTFTGGITIDKSVQLVGAGPGATTIEGGGPVITIGEFFGANRPTVSISRVTIEGGLNNSKPDTAVTAGGGVWIPQSAGNATGATVTIADSVIAGNRVAPKTLIPPGFCGPFACAFALGGGIDNSGTLTVTRTWISDNVADSSIASNASGGGIFNHPQGRLTLRHSFVTGNRAAVTAPNGRFADSGGIGNDGQLTIEDSVVNGNSVEVASAVPSSFPFGIGQEAVAGGIRISDFPGASAMIARTTISGNTVSSTNLGGDAQAVSGGIDADGSLLLVDSRVDHNRVVASVPPSSGFLAGAVFGGIEVQGVATIRDSSVSGNVLDATSATGAANVAGGGVANLSGRVTLERTRVIGNRGAATGVSGLALGGGILNIAFAGGPPELTVTDSVVTANALTASPGITIQGGGIFTADVFSGDPFAVTLSGTVIAGNKPDECFGC